MSNCSVASASLAIVKEGLQCCVDVFCGNHVKGPAVAVVVSACLFDSLCTIDIFNEVLLHICFATRGDLALIKAGSDRIKS